MTTYTLTADQLASLIATGITLGYAGQRLGLPERQAIADATGGPEFTRLLTGIAAATAPTPAEPDADEREALIDALVMTPMADHIGTDLAPVERTADALLAAGYSRTPDAHLAASKAEALEEAADEWEQEDTDFVGDWLRARAARLREQGNNQ